MRASWPVLRAVSRGFVRRIALPLCVGFAAAFAAGEAVAQAHVVASPLRIDFAPAPLQGGDIAKVVVVNGGDAAAHLDPHLVAPFSNFSILHGGGPRELAPDGRHVLWVQFRAGLPSYPDYFQDALFVAEGCPLVPLTGGCRESAASCVVGASYLDFDRLPPGDSLTFSVLVANRLAGESLVLTPWTTDEEFRVVPERLVIPPGESRYVIVMYAPVVEGVHVGAVVLGEDACLAIALRGECTSGGPRTEDLVGLWWNESLTVDVSQDMASGTPFLAWLAMLNPSEPEGVGGWELKLDLDEATYLTHVKLEGSAFNILDAPSFFVGVAAPLPWAPQVLLARLRFLVLDHEWHEVGLVPIERPSLPGRLAWAYGPEFTLKPLYPTTGGPAVAWFRATTTVATAAPAPDAILAAGRVELRWPLPADGAEGCHLYRAVDGAEARLTAAPLAPQGRGYLFVDDASGLPAGATVAYSYAVVRGGVEIVRSPAAAVDLPGPVVAAARLLPNRPNPFNPATEIAFELARAGRARLAVYDAAGRRVAVLADAGFSAGTHRVTWRGLDAAGRPVPGGTYLVRLETESGLDRRKLMLIK